MSSTGIGGLRILSEGREVCEITSGRLFRAIDRMMAIG
jgi:hypothetical protein